MKVKIGLLLGLLAALCIEHTSAEECSIGSYGPNPANCNSFLQCVFGNWVVRPCPTNLHWNDNFKTCTYPQHAKCVVSTTSTTTTTTEQTTIIEDETTEPTTTIQQETITGQGTESTQSTNECGCGEHRANKYDCSSFYRCVNGLFVSQACPIGLQWNSENELCDWPENSDCGSLGNTTTYEEITTKSTIESTKAPDATEESITSEVVSTEGPTSTKESVNKPLTTTEPPTTTTQAPTKPATITEPPITITTQAPITEAPTIRTTTKQSTTTTTTQEPTFTEDVVSTEEENDYGNDYDNNYDENDEEHTPPPWWE